MLSGGFAVCAVTAGPASASLGWSEGGTVPLPAQALGGGFEGVSCAAAGDCAAVGSFTDTSGESRTMVADQLAGTWGAAHEVALPANADSYQPRGWLQQVSCSAPGWCAAIGRYQDDTGQLRPMVISELAGTWAPAASEVQLPSPAESEEEVDPPLRSVSCGAPGSCVAVGTYIESEDNQRAIVVSSTNGVWESTATRVSPPGSPEQNSSSALQSVSCCGGGSCYAVAGFL
jgi:hypothetical protein